ncbi:hypothetical protein GHT06_012459 [Daphnia sinensis]|uniref:Protein kinase domain-containing protein n=1 Tax=Daphnia sinensis TaxID=1820382 RepID=A0AAD5KVV0_9CRUS|nr:hypothetical protein GHT06_012459 [Daphnia sinensis]
MADKGGGSLCFEDLQLNSSSSLQCDGNNENIFLRKIKGETLAVKKLAPTCDGVCQQEDQWEKLIKLRDNHIVCYRQCVIHQDVRYLVMESCQGSMLNYCRKNLDESVASLVKGIDIMWQVTCGVDYLHRIKISHGDLNLENVLFWRRGLKSKRVVVKITGYGYKDFQPRDNVKSRLGILYYATATKQEVVPNEPITLESLTEIDEKHRALALDLIRIPTMADLSDLLRHPLFIRCIEESRSKLFRELQMDGELFRVLCNQETLQEWEGCLDKSKFPDEEFEDLKDTMLADNDKITSLLGEAFETTPLLFSEYIWHITTSLKISKDNKNQSIEILEKLGEGNYGKVFKCNYTDESGKTYLAACKKCSPNPDAVDVFNREIQTLRQLNHLFVVKYLDLVKIQSKKYIVMELCEGSLKDYFEGKLGRIPKDSLGDEILISQVALGVAYIHSKDIIHKDLKLANILLWCQPSNSRIVLAKIADFGFAKELKPGQTEFSDTVHPGTENYMAPELLNTKGSAYPASFASDVYAFGIIIARIAKKGAHPYSSEDTWRKHSMVHGLVPQNIQDLSWDLKDLILKLTDSDPGKRPMMALLKPDILPDMVYPEKEYYRDIKEGIATEYDPEVGFQFDKMKRNTRLSRYSLGKLILQSPKLLVPYFWAHLPFILSLNKQLASSVLDKENNQQNTTSTASRPQPLSRETDPEVQRNHTIISEIEWSSLFCEEELVNELWNIKYEGQYNKSPEREREIIGLVANCKITEEVWSVILDQLESQIGILLEQIVQSSACNVPKLIHLILKRYGSQLKLDVLLAMHSIAANVGDQAAEIMQILFEHGAAANAQLYTGKYGYLPIHHAATNDSPTTPKMIKVLLEHGANPCALSGNGYTPLHLAAGNEGNCATEIVKQLLDYGGSSNANDLLNSLASALLNNGECGPALVELLLKNIKTEALEIEGMLANLAMANQVHGPKMLELVLEKGVKFIRAGKRKVTPLHCAVMQQTTQTLAIIKILLEYGSDLNAIDELGNTPIHYAAINEGEHAYETLKFLLSKGGDVIIKRKDGFPPVHLALTNTGICGDKIRKLVGVDRENVNEPIDSTGITLLHLFVTAKYAKVDIVKLILDHGGNPNTENKLGISPVHAALENHSNIGLTILRLLLLKGGNPNCLMSDDEYRFTLYRLVHRVAATLQEEAVEQMTILLENNGNVNASSKDGDTPMHLAAHNPGIHAPNLVRILLNHGGHPNAVGSHRRTPLHIAIGNENDNVRIETIRFLLEKGGNPNAGDVAGPHRFIMSFHDDQRMSPFIYAIRTGSEKYCLPDVKNYFMEMVRKEKNVFKVLHERTG